MFTHWGIGFQVGCRWQRSLNTRITITHDCTPVALAWDWKYRGERLEIMQIE